MKVAVKSMFTLGTNLRIVIEEHMQRKITIETFQL